jgi:hypothetical protein
MNSLKIHNFLLAPSQYDSDAQKEIVFDSINQGTKQLLDGSADRQAAEIEKASWRMIRVLAVVAGFLKHSSFSEEKEWRLVSRMIDSRVPEFGYRKGQSFIVPYFRFGLVDEPDEWPIKTVIVGPTPHKDLAADSILQLLSSKGIRGFSVTNSTIPYRNW